MSTAKARRIHPTETEASTDALALVFERSRDALGLVRDGKFVRVNRAFELLSGHSRESVINQSAEVLAVDSASLPAKKLRKFNMSLLGVEGTFEDVGIRTSSGELKVVDLTVRSLSSDQEVFIQLHDMTEKKRMEQELIARHTEIRTAYLELEKKNTELQSMQQTLVQAGKMAALGELAAGIAHELNQPLQGIKGYTQEIQAISKPTGEVETFLKEIVSCVDKMGAIIGYLRSFTRKSTEAHELIDVKIPVEESLKMLARQFSSRGIVVHRDFDPSVPEVYCNPLQLEQVFINLASNARDAIESTGRGGGNLWISTRSLGDVIEISFKDDGCGMSERTRQKIFNPFFTTKEVGRGMGLGLSLSYGIISKLHGTIQVESESDRGTTFRVRIPRDLREMG